MIVKEEEGKLWVETLSHRIRSQKLGWTGGELDFFEGLGWAAPMSLPHWVPTS